MVIAPIGAASVAAPPRAASAVAPARSDFAQALRAARSGAEAPPGAPIAAASPATSGSAAASARAGLERSSSPGAGPTTASGAPRSPFLSAATGLERAQRQLDGMLAAARRGQTFTAQELIALQAQAYRVSQSVELAGRLVEQGAQSVKHAVNTQV
jgi:hypothetical protein